MSSAFHFSLVDLPNDILSLAAELDDRTAGAVFTFDGLVSDHHGGRAVSHLEYQACPALAISMGQKILEEECARHGILRARAAHRTGPLAIGEAVVWVGVASAHRGLAFDAARAIMERLKYELPIWKKAIYADGFTEWVGPDSKSAETGLVRDVFPEWNADLLEIWISAGNDFRGRHEQGRLDHGITGVSEIECVAGMGLRGDRYFGYKQNFKGQVTFFEAETVAAVRNRFGKSDLSSSVFRRNLIVRGVSLGDWIGRRFRFQGIGFEGTEECKPCYWMDEVTAPGAEKFLKQNFRGGLRARILTSGVVRAVRQ